MGKVYELKSKLNKIGFLETKWVVNISDEEKEEKNAAYWRAIREFQRYASMQWAATKLKPGATSAAGQDLKNVFVGVKLPEKARYKGAIDGNDTTTTDLIALWEKDELHCPVITQLYTRVDNSQATEKTPVSFAYQPTARIDLWDGKECLAPNTYVFATDFSQYFTTDKNPTVPVPVGHLARVGGQPRGPLSDIPPPGYTHCEASWPTMIKNIGIFRILRAIADVECHGYLDAINAWDDAFLSVGIFQWSLAAKGGMSANAELGGFLSFLKHGSPKSYDRLITNFGLDVEEDWGEKGEKLQTGIGIYTTNLLQRAISPSSTDPEFEAIATLSEFRGWHWVYRFEQAVRTDPLLQECMWKMALLRLQDVLGTEFRPDAGVGKAGDGNARYCDVFRSEKTIAMLLRWHVIQPSHVVKNNESTPYIEKLVALIPKAVRNGDPNNWAKDVQQLLVHGFLTQTSGDVARTLAIIDRWPGTPTATGPLSTLVDPKLITDLFAIDTLAPAGATPPPKSTEATTIQAGVSPPANIGQPRPAASFLLMRALSAGKETFRIAAELANDSAAQYTLVCYAGNDPKANLDKEHGSVDQIQFLSYPDEERKEKPFVLWEVAIPLGTLQPPAMTKSTLKLDFSIRVLFQPIPVELPQYIKPTVPMQVEIQMSESATPEVKFSSIKIQYFGVNQKWDALKNDITLAEDITFAALAADPNNYRFFRNADAATDYPGGIYPPKIAGAVGFEDIMKLKDTIKKLVLECNIRFKENGSPERRCLLEFEIAIQIDEDVTAKISAFNFAVESNGYPRTPKSAGGDLTCHYVRFWQRQPEAGPLIVNDHIARWVFEMTIPHGPMLTWWNLNVVKPICAAIPTVEAGRNATFLPTLTACSVDETELEQNTWVARYLVFDGYTNKDFALSPDDFKVVLPPSNIVPKAGHIILYPRSLQPLKQDDATDATPACRAKAVFSGLRVQQGPHSVPQGSHCSYCTLDAGPVIYDNAIFPPPYIDFQCRYQEYVQPAAEVRLRLQGLDLFLPEPTGEWGGSKVLDTQQDLLHARWHFVLVNEKPVGITVTFCKAEIGLSALRFCGGSEDPFPGEEFELDEAAGGTDAPRPAALVCAPGTAALLSVSANASPPYRLQVTEQVSQVASHSITLQLKQREPMAIETDLFIIDPAPLSIFRVISYDAAEERLQGGLNEIGNWGIRPDGASNWQVSLSGLSYSALLPPQAIGESMHRSRDANDMSPNAVADMRFAPPATLQLYTSETRQRFVELPWNLRRRLGYPGQRNPGNLIEQMNIELVYGIRCEITAPALRVAEIQARLGQIPPYLPPSLPWKSSQAQHDVFDSYRGFWHSLLDVVRSRIAVYEPYFPTGLPDQLPSPGAHNPSAAAPTAPFEITTEQGLTVRLRRNAELAYPVPGIQAPEGLPSVGLKGSFAWAFESANIYNELWEKESEAVSASLSALRLSALGGWGHLRASFGANSIIDATVSMGRIDRLAIERKGHINNFWNRAKHVIVYERTVAPTRQFMLEQYAFLGSAILRKTEEYIVIEQPERHVHEGTDSPEPMLAGCVQACLFPESNSGRINVNSRWGSDVGKIGWKVPLWVRGAAPADVYPKPDIRLICITDRGLPEDSVINNPEICYFYTSTQEKDQDKTPDEWLPVKTVDFDDVPVDLQLMPDNSNKAPAIAGGLERFTYQLGPSRALNLVAGRWPETVATRLSTLTLMRGPLKSPASASTDSRTALVTPLGTALGISGAVANQLIPLSAQLAASLAGLMQDDGNADAVYSDCITSAFTQLRQLATAALTTLSPTRQMVKDAIVQRLQRTYIAFGQEIIDSANQILYEFAAKASSVLTDAANDLAEGDTLSKDMREILLAVLEQLFNGELGAEEPGLATRLSQIRGLPGEFAAVKVRTLDALDETYGHTMDILNSTAKTVELLIGMGSPQEDVERLLSQTLDQVQDAVSSIDMLAAEAGRRWLGRSFSTARIATISQWNALYVATNSLRYALRAADPLKSFNDNFTSFCGDKAAFPQYYTAVRVAVDAMTGAAETGQLNDIADQLELKIKAAINEAIDGKTSISEMVTKINNNAAEMLSDEKLLNNALTGINIAAEADYVIDHGNIIIFEAQTLVNYFNKILTDKILTDTNLSYLLKLFINANLTIVELRERLDELQTIALRFAEEFTGFVQLIVPETPEIPQDMEGAITLLRAFGQAPAAPGLHFDRTALQGVAYGFIGKAADNSIKALDTIAMTQLQAVAGDVKRQLGEFEQSANALVPLNLSFPTNALLDRLLPDPKNFSLATIFNNLAGIPFQYLFADVQLPQSVGDHLKVRQEFDPQTLTGRVHIEVVDVNLRADKNSPVPVFSLAGVTLTLLSASFNATVDMIAAKGQPLQTRAEGQITGNWELQIGDFSIVTLANTTLSFDADGHIHFDITPSNVQLTDILAAFADLLKQAGGSDDSGLTFNLTPTGAETVLSLPLPDTQAGAFGLANVNFGLRFGLDFAEQFTLSTGMFLGRRTAPFTLTVFVLGGAGWFECDLNFIPATGQFVTTVSIAVMASAGLAISLGPLQGGVYAYFGIAVEYRGQTGQAGSLTVGVVLLFNGKITLLGLVDVELALGLQANYNSSDHSLVGRGSVQYTVKIGWFIDIDIHTDVEYHYGQSARQLERARAEAFSGLPDYYDKAAEEYFSMFEPVSASTTPRGGLV